MWVLPLTYFEWVIGLGSGVAAHCTLCCSCKMQTARVWKECEGLCDHRAPVEELSICSTRNSGIMAFSAVKNHFGGGKMHWRMWCNYSHSDTASEIKQITSIHAEMESRGHLKTNNKTATSKKPKTTTTEKRTKQNKQKTTHQPWNNVYLLDCNCLFKILMEVTGLE